jgi:hypothetical protein
MVMKIFLLMCKFKICVVIVLFSILLLTDYIINFFYLLFLVIMLANVARE